MSEERWTQTSAHRIARIANGNWNKALEELDSRK